jgi:tetratricopeptide (TPR) repeat protein
MLKILLSLGLFIGLVYGSTFAQTSTVPLSAIEVEFADLVTHADNHLEFGSRTVAQSSLNDASVMLAQNQTAIRPFLQGHFNKVNGKLWMKDNPVLALQYFTAASAQFIGNPLELAVTDMFIGITFYNQADYVSAQTLFMSSKQVFEQNNDQLNLAQVLNNIGAVYYKQSSRTLAISNTTQALSINLTISHLRNATINQQNLFIIIQLTRPFFQPSGFSDQSEKVTDQSDANQSPNQDFGSGGSVPEGAVKTNGSGTIVINK